MTTANEYALQLAQIKVLKERVAEIERSVRDAAEADMEPGDRAGAKLRDGTRVGGITFSEGAESKLKIVNETAFLLWVKKNHPSEIVVTESVRSSFRDAAITQVAVTGDIPDGVEMSTAGKPHITVPALPKGAAEAIIADFRANGIGSVFTLPAIEN